LGQNAAPGRYEELVETALQLFRQKGYHATSMQDIADSMGLRKASLYHYIDAKEDLLVAIYRRIVSDYTERIRLISEGPGSARERLARAVQSHLESIISHADMFAVYLSENRWLPPAHRERCAKPAATTGGGLKPSSAKASRPANSSRWIPTSPRCSSSARATGCPNGIRPMAK